jgi:glutathione reductase (NADPH)
MAFDYDLFTIGAGSGGVAASRRAAAHGARVAIAEDRRVGGTCVLRGCVPKKLLVYGTHFAEELEDARGYGWTVEGARFDWGALVAAKDRETDRLHGIYSRLLAGSGVAVHEGRARIVAANTVEVAGKRITARHILVATGGRPERLAVPGAELAIDSDQALDLRELPRRVAILGGGYIAVEFAGIFRAAGAEVTQVIRAERVLRGFDDECRAHLQAEMARKGVRFLAGAEAARIDRVAGGLRLELKDGTALEVDQVMMATGRRPNTAGLGLEEAGVTLDKAGAIAVDEWRRRRRASTPSGTSRTASTSRPWRSPRAGASPRRCSTATRRAWTIPASPAPCSASRRSARSACPRRPRPLNAGRSTSTPRCSAP